VIGTMVGECLDRMPILGRRHLEAVLAEHVEPSNAHRPHRALGQRSPSALDATPAPIDDVDPATLRRSDRLGGLTHEYRMAACGGQPGRLAPTGQDCHGRHGHPHARGGRATVLGRIA